MHYIINILLHEQFGIHTQQIILFEANAMTELSFKIPVSSTNTFFVIACMYQSYVCLFLNVYVVRRFYVFVLTYKWEKGKCVHNVVMLLLEFLKRYTHTHALYAYLQ